jgi:rod shape-determining protein MreC
MQKKSFTFYFLVLFVLSILIFGASKIGWLNPVDSLLKDIFSPVQSLTHNMYIGITGFGQNSEIQALKAQNLMFTQKLVDQSKLIADNNALRDQFATENPKSVNLIEADVVGAVGFVPGLSVPEAFTINRGAEDNVKIGDAVVYKNNLVGKITQISAKLSNVTLVGNASSQFIAETLATKAAGIIKGQGGGEIILDNVLLSNSLKTGDLVLTQGDINIKNSGFPPGLVVGKIVSVSKNPSDLFQKADVQPLINFSNLEKVFVVVNY